MSNIPFEEVLHPNPDELMKAEMAMGGGMEQAVKASQFDVRKSMNAMKTVGEALLKVLNDSPKSEDFNQILNEASRVARLLLLKWGVNPEDKQNVWMGNVIEKAIMPYISLTPLSDEMIDVLATRLVEKAQEYPENAAFKDQQMVTLNIFKGLNKIAKEQSDYDFLRKNKEKDLEFIRDTVLQSATSYLEELAPVVTPHEDRVVFMSMIVEQLFDIMSVSWRRNAQKAQQAMSTLSEAQIKAWKQAHPQGFELKPVVEYFDQNAQRLLRLSVQSRKKTKKV